MKIFKKLLKPIETSYVPETDFSLRVPGGMEICKSNSVSSRTPLAPRLIVAEPSRAEDNNIVLKKRSEINGLESLLRTITATR